MRWLLVATLTGSAVFADDTQTPIEKCLSAKYCVKVAGPADDFRFEAVRGDTGKVEYLTINTFGPTSLKTVTESDLFYESLNAAKLLGIITDDGATMILIRRAINDGIEQSIEDGTFEETWRRKMRASP